MSWQVTVRVLCKGDKSFVLSPPQLKGLFETMDPVKYLKTVAFEEDLKFESLNVEFKKSGLISAEDLQKILSQTTRKMFSTDSSHQLSE